ncbi:entry exclusion lipoprotein TrbK [Pseudoduganella chitinolytica]|uniref:Entry exclusion lipoprotein TrbK n=1 Tax=Pseudoduganella chitinolytica TaxID=34070 RepID=A0ABY8B8Z4_9BURK|nr:entry exclusion lipoprotein TrbK [Pseudoduganella chitinolytica]WEF31453.1 entry exclusion lipoprotein TrbK [Pseudoduganella chitinolytica]
MNTYPTIALALASAIVAVACSSKVDPQLQADQMTLSDATCAQAEVDKIADEAVRKAFAARCARRVTTAQ